MAKEPQDKILRSTRVAREAFLAAYASHGCITEAAKTAGISRITHYQWLEADDDYAIAFEEAKEKAVDVLEFEAHRRAVTGVEKPVFQGKEHVGDVREYSDRLLEFLLKGAAPEKYADRSKVQHSGTLKHEVEAFIEPEDLLAEFAADINRAKALRLEGNGHHQNGNGHAG